MMLKPLGSHLIVEPADKESKTASGIIIPDTADKERPERGTIVAVGPGKMLENGNREVLEVKVGDVVVFKKYGPDEVKVGDKTYLVLSAEDVIATLE